MTVTLRTRPAISLVLLSAACLLACGGEDPPLTRSCAGEAIPNCRPYEYAVVTAASLEPDGILVGDPAATVHIRVELDTCGDRSPGPHTVAIRALVTTGGAAGADAGSSGRILSLEEVADDGVTFGDEVARDGSIDVFVPNPFIGDVPVDTDMTLRLAPRLNTCEGDTFELPYRTGARWAPPPGG
jgi:hypothetical protein